MKKHVAIADGTVSAIYFSARPLQWQGDLRSNAMSKRDHTAKDCSRNNSGLGCHSELNRPRRHFEDRSTWIVPLFFPSQGNRPSIAPSLRCPSYVNLRETRRRKLKSGR